MLNLQNIDLHSSVNVISIGMDCLPRNISTKWGFKKPRVLGELSMPFDLAIHPVQAVIELLRTNFSDYTSPKFIQFSETRNYPIHAKYKIEWNHELGRTWASDDFNSITNLYRRRIENLRYALNDGKLSLLFLRASYHFTHSDLDALSEAVSALQRMSRNRIAAFCILTGSTDLENGGVSLPLRAEGGELGIQVCRVPLPHQKYVWHEYEWYTRHEGLEFELACIEYLKSFISELHPNVASSLVA
jgi:hypothetical protein